LLPHEFIAWDNWPHDEFVRQRGAIVEKSHYCPSGTRFYTESTSNSNALAYRYNGKEMETMNGLNQMDYGARRRFSWNPSWTAVDPLAEKYYSMSPYVYCAGNPVNRFDPDGMSFYYSTDGTFIGEYGDDNTDVYVIQGNKYYANTKKHQLIYANKDATQLKYGDVTAVTHEVFLAFASMINRESSGNHDESYGIGNATMNYLSSGGSSQIKTLEDVAMYANSYAYGAKQVYYSDFMDLSADEKNGKFAVGSAINAIGYAQGTDGFGFKDYSNNATAWDGTDLIDSHRSNGHRTVKWSSDSESLLHQYQVDNNGGINTSNFNYVNKRSDRSAVYILGKTIFETINSGRGEGRKNNRFR